MALHYQYAKDLKKAGFPQNGKDGDWTTAFGKIKFLDESWRAYIPTLAELIAACGTEFEGLDLAFNQKDWWRASSKDFSEGRKNAHGQTPEIAVARLWLSLAARDSPKRDAALWSAGEALGQAAPAISETLAKELKDTGYSQGKANAPKLEKLITACGFQFESLTESGGSWQAKSPKVYRDKKNLESGQHVSGDYPDEAVARLWLAVRRDGRLERNTVGIFWKVAGLSFIVILFAAVALWIRYAQVYGW